ncbi:peptidylprolyl isomerase [Nocardioides sp.]|uniref:peptidylprolyl isomerase n=1 Tax=Nocardioides sp. TaxID=35761 RepID=UPI003512D430
MTRRPAARLVASLLALGTALALAGCGDDEPTAGSGVDAPAAERTHAPQPEDPAGAPCTYTEDPTSPAARPADPPAATAAYSGDVAAVIETDAGDIPITLDAAVAPCTVNSFTSLASQGYFDDTPCHRLTTAPGFGVLQCGDPSGTGFGGPGYSFADELDGAPAADASGFATYPAGTLAMANAGPDTNGSQFFIVYEDTTLKPLYNVFGTIDEAGLEVVRGIAEGGVDDSNGPGDGTPLTPVQIGFVDIQG